MNGLKVLFGICFILGFIPATEVLLTSLLDVELPLLFFLYLGVGFFYQLMTGSLGGERGAAEFIGGSMLLAALAVLSFQAGHLGRWILWS